MLSHALLLQNTTMLPNNRCHFPQSILSCYDTHHKVLFRVYIHGPCVTVSFRKIIREASAVRLLALWKEWFFASDSVSAAAFSKRVLYASCLSTDCFGLLIAESNKS